MNCTNHSQRVTETACSGCQRPFCDDCLVRFEKLALCASCKAKYLEGVEERPDRVARPRPRADAGGRSQTLLWIGGAGALVFSMIFVFVVIAGLAGPLSDWRDNRRYADATNALVSIGAALERHRADTGEFPDRLAELVPAYLSKIPRDPYGDGEPRYAFVEDKRRLWSIGPDEKDDGGTSPGDLVYSVDVPR